MSWTDKKLSLPSFLGSSEKQKPLPAPPNQDEHHVAVASTSSLFGNSKSVAEEQPILMKAILKKIKKNNQFTKKFFVLYDRTADIPAKLVYFDSEKKYLHNRFQPKREIILKTCLNINRRRDAKDARGQEFIGLDIYTPEDRLQISFDNHEEELNEWLENLLILHQGATNNYGRKPQPNFDVIWQVNLKGFEPDAGNDVRGHPMVGSYRLGVTPEYIELFRLGEERGKKLHHPCIRKFMLKDKQKVLGIDLGRTSPIGPGVLSLESEEKDSILHLHDSLVKAMRGTGGNSKEMFGIPGRIRSSSLGQDRVPKASGISHIAPNKSSIYRSDLSRIRTVSEPVDGGGVISKIGGINLDRHRGGRMQGVGSPTSPMGSTAALSDGGTGSSSSINDPVMDLDPHFSHQPEVIPEESSGEISIDFNQQHGTSVDNSLSAFSKKDTHELASGTLPRQSRANVMHLKQPSLPDDYMRMDMNTDRPPPLPARNQEFLLSTSLPSSGGATSKVSQSTTSPTDSQPSCSLSSDYPSKPGGGSGTQHSTPLLSPDNPYLPMDQIVQMHSTPPRTSTLLQSSPPTTTNTATTVPPPLRQALPSPRSFPQLEGLNTSTSSTTPAVQQPSIIQQLTGSSGAEFVSTKGRVRQPSGENSYVVMSPGVQINLDNAGTCADEPASLAAIEEALGGRWHSPFHTSPVMRRSSSKPVLPEDSKRNSSILDETDTSFSWRLNEDLDFTEDSDPRGMSPTGPTDDYMLIDYPRSGMGSTPRPISRSSPASSSSAMCGTPSSVTRMAEMDRLEKVQSYLMDQDDEKPAVPTSSRPPRGDTSGRTSKSGRYIDIPNSKLSPRGNFHLSGRTPPSSGHSGSPGAGVVSRIEGWFGFRNRAGSVPNRPNLHERRRHRTQSEGEKDVGNEESINNLQGDTR